ncbi:MAG: nucleotide pyrophosphohydrolase [Candidatus Omnitrophica bacterium]|nr:nucleotide pyrophosphohydrolase [Candidatus Omnitrophota bacterium]
MNASKGRDDLTTIDHLKKKLAKFVKDRDWAQYHSPKNLSMSIAIEAAELMEVFQWANIEESHKILKNKKKLEDIKDELADIAMFVMEFCNMFDIDLSSAVLKKLKKNAKKYPTQLVKGKTHKYTYYK